MKLNDEQYEQVAQWLDAAEAGRPSLDAAQRAAADEIARYEADLAGALHVDAPPDALAKARARMLAELARPWWRTRWGARAAAAAAIVAIVTTAALLAPRTPPIVPNKPVADISAEVMGQMMAETIEPDVMDLLADELASIEAAPFIAMDDGALEMRIDAIEDDLLEGTLIDDTTTWLLDDEGLSS